MSQKTYRSYPFVPNAAQELQLKLTWLVRLRALAALGQLLCLLAAVQLGFVSGTTMSWALVPIGFLVAFNLYALLTRSVARHLNEWHVWLQLSFDLLAVTTLLVITGGAGNPFHGILFLHATLGALLLRGYHSWMFLGLLVVALHLMAFPRFQPLSGSFLVTWYGPRLVVMVTNFLLVSYLARLLSTYRAYLTRSTRARLHMDRLHGIGALTAGLCHEMRTPLNTLQIRLERLQRAINPHTDLEAAQAAVSQCERILANLIDSKADPDQFGFSVVNLAVLVSDVTREWHTDKPGISLELVQEGQDFRCEVPRIPFANIVCDLLDNAAEAMGGKGSLSVMVSAKGHHRRVSILDQGPGWPTLVQERLGEPFLSTKKAGVGLGLYNAHLLVEGLSGRLTLENLAQGGASVHIDLPERLGGPLA